MKTYRIANTDLEVSRLALGTMHLGGQWGPEPIEPEHVCQAEALIETALHLGINHLDLADIYTFGKSDQVVGRVLKNRPEFRDRLVLQEKFGIVLAGDPDAGPPQRYCLSYQHIVESLEASLIRLETDRVDILALHRPDPLIQPEEVARAFDHLHQSGKVRYFGVSNHSAAQIELLNSCVDQPLVVNQLELSLVHHQLISDGLLINTDNPTQTGVSGLLDYCRLNGITVQAWSPLAGGQLNTGQGLSPLLTEMADRLATTPQALALAWLLRHPAGIQPVLGTRSPQRLESCAAAADIELSRRDWYQLLEASRGQPAP